MKVSFFFLLLFLLPETTLAQNFNGFIVTTQDSLVKGYMRIQLGERGREFLITQDKRKKARKYHLEDLKYYALKKDTFAVLKNFYPFEDENIPVEIMEAKVVISKGKLRLYWGALPGYKGLQYSVYTPNGNMPMQDTYDTYIIKTGDGTLRAVKYENEKFVESIRYLVEDRPELLGKINEGKLKYKNMVEIIRIYNK